MTRVFEEGRPPQSGRPPNSAPQRAAHVTRNPGIGHGNAASPGRWRFAITDRASGIEHASFVAVALTLAIHARDDGSNCRPGREGLAARSRLSEATVKRALGWLREHGWIERTRIGNRALGEADVYQLTIPTDDVDTSTKVHHGSHMTHDAPPITGHGHTDHGSPVNESRVTGDPPTPTGTPTRKTPVPSAPPTGSPGGERGSARCRERARRGRVAAPIESNNPTIKRIVAGLIADGWVTSGHDYLVDGDLDGGAALADELQERLEAEGIDADAEVTWSRVTNGDSLFSIVGGAIKGLDAQDGSAWR